MAFQKGDKVLTDEDNMGEILFIDNDGLEAQVALEQLTMRLRTDTLRVFDENVHAAANLSKPAATKTKRAKRTMKK